MATLTVSTDGVSDGKDCHDAEKVAARTTWGANRPRYEVSLTMTTDQALDIAYDLLYQAVDAGEISGWSVQFPDEVVQRDTREAASASTTS